LLIEHQMRPLLERLLEGFQLEQENGQCRIPLENGVSFRRLEVGLTLMRMASARALARISFARPSALARRILASRSPSVWYRTTEPVPPARMRSKTVEVMLSGRPSCLMPSSSTSTRNPRAPGLDPLEHVALDQVELLLGHVGGDEVAERMLADDLALALRTTGSSVRSASTRSPLNRSRNTLGRRCATPHRPSRGG